MSESNGTDHGFECPTIALGGRTKIGKSSEIIRAFAGRCFYVCCEKNAITPALNPEVNRTLLGPNPWRPRRGIDFVECLSETDPIGEVRDVIEAIKPRLGVRNGFAAVAVDTMSELVDRDFKWGCDPKPDGAGWGREYANHYRTEYDRVKSLVRKLQSCGVIVIATFHEQEPSTLQGRFKAGGLRLPGQLVKDLPSLFDFVLRCGVEADSNGEPRPVFRCNRLDTDYVTGDRYGVMLPVEPMDLRSVYRRAVFAARGQWPEVLRERARVQAVLDGGTGTAAAEVVSP